MSPSACQSRRPARRNQCRLRLDALEGRWAESSAKTPAGQGLLEEWQSLAEVLLRRDLRGFGRLTSLFGLRRQAGLARAEFVRVLKTGGWVAAVH